MSIRICESISDGDVPDFLDFATEASFSVSIAGKTEAVGLWSSPEGWVALRYTATELRVVGGGRVMAATRTGINTAPLRPKFSAVGAYRKEVTRLQELHDALVWGVTQ